MWDQVPAPIRRHALLPALGEATAHPAVRPQVGGTVVDVRAVVLSGEVLPGERRPAELRRGAKVPRVVQKCLHRSHQDYSLYSSLISLGRIGVLAYDAYECCKSFHILQRSAPLKGPNALVKHPLQHLTWQTSTCPNITHSRPILTGQVRIGARRVSCGSRGDGPARRVTPRSPPIQP